MARRRLDPAERDAAARRYLESSARIAAIGCHIEAGEVMWGALTNALNALSRKRRNRDLGSNGARVQFIRDMIDERVLLKGDMHFFYGVGAGLHKRFYTPPARDDDYADDLADIRALVERLLAAAIGGA